MNKIVVESLYELYKFEKKANSLSSLGVGKTAIITKWLDDHDVENYIINDDFTIDVNNEVNLYLQDETELPEYMQFNEINGDFDISENKLVTLRGCPRIIHGNFFCYDNEVEFSRYYIILEGIAVEKNIYNKKW
jgi:hypothetical protein